MKAIHMSVKVINKFRGMGVMLRYSKHEGKGLSAQSFECLRMTAYYLPHQLVSCAPDVNNLDIRVGLQVTAQFGNEYIKTTRIEERIITPKVL